MIPKINERISVDTTSNSTTGSSIPVRFHWHGNSYEIKKLAYYHKIREGRTIYHIFHVSTEGMDFRLKFNSDTLQWILEEATDGAAN